MLTQKKAFGGVVGTLIMFIAVVSVATGLVISFKGYISETQSSLAFQNEVAVNKLKTSISITHMYFNSTDDQLYVYVKNIGETKLRPQNFDLFVDGAYYRNFTHYYANDIETEMVLFNPQETMVIIQNLTMTSGTHEVRVITEHGVGTEDSFNI